MTTPTIHTLGAKLRPLESIPVVGALLGMKTRSSAYAAAETNDWPTTNTTPNRRLVIVPVLLDRLGIPYTVEIEEEGK